MVPEELKCRHHILAYLGPTLGIATPQKPMPAPMDRLRENIAIEAIACQENLLFAVHVNYSISYFCLLEEHTQFVNSCKICKFVLPASKSLADFPSSAQMVKKLISPPSFSTVEAQLKHD